LKTVNIHLFI